VKPAVILFSDSNPAPDTKKKEEAALLPAAVMIDKDGAKTIAMPSERREAPQIAAVAVKPELMQPAAPDSAPTQPIPIAPSADGAPVDRRLMQRGFSHAFDELLQPAPATASASDGTNP
jgi:hypothetical protein